jgi:hypothetical protein
MMRASESPMAAARAETCSAVRGIGGNELNINLFRISFGAPAIRTAGGNRIKQYSLQAAVTDGKI